jgi:hypothetical protein
MSDANDATAPSGDGRASVPASPCRNLRSKEMYYAYGQEDDEFASGCFWCAKTQEGFGPDGQAVSKAECCNGRTCYIS